MLKSFENRTLALAGMFQAGVLVRDIARQGKEINSSVEASIHSLFETSAQTVEAVYGGITGVAKGLRTLVNQIGMQGNSSRDLEVTRYVIALIYLERKLLRNAGMMQQLSDGIDAAAKQAEYFSSETHSSVIASLADLYRETVSTLPPKIMVHGEPEILSNPDNTNLIRALLLAGIRSAILWRQCGGSRFQLLFRRRKIMQAAVDQLNSLSDSHLVH